MKTTPAPPSLARKIHEERFNGTGTPRSVAYQLGALAALRKHTGETKTAGPCPYELGTAEADAWFSGADAAKNMHAMHLLREREAAEKAGKEEA